jgi:pyridoxine 4-dehydrogenase
MTTYSIGNKKFGPSGYGLMGFTWTPSVRVSDEQAFAALKKAVELNSTFWNGGEFYGRPEPTDNLALIGRYFDKYPEDADKVFLSIKGGVDSKLWMPDGTPECIRNSINTCLKFLQGKKSLDMFTLARVGKVEIEESVKAIKEFVDAGKVGAICLSEVSAETIRRAVKVAPIAAVEIEFSLWSREAESNGVFQVCKELGIPVIAYSPIGKGFFSGVFKSPADLPKDDMRLLFDRFQDDNFAKNSVLIEKLTELAKRKGATNTQIALSWIRTLSNTGDYPVIIPIPGTTNVNRVVENSTHIDLSSEDVKEINSFLESFSVSGLRYNKHAEIHNYK